jgi:CheY-like chemotaxis protein
LSKKMDLTAPPMPGTLILLVDDIPDHAALYEYALQQAGYLVRLARTGAEALVVARCEGPHCAVIDVRLPDMSGWDLCRSIKADSQSCDIPVVVLTQEVTNTCADDSAKSGCNAWLAHPTFAPDLVRSVDYVLAQERDAPDSPDEALLGLTACPSCGANKIRATLRLSGVQYYCCKSCNLCWRVDAVQRAV